MENDGERGVERELAGNDIRSHPLYRIHFCVCPERRVTGIPEHRTDN